MQARGLEKSRHNLVATMLAEQMVEEAMAAGYERAKDQEPTPIDMEIESRDKSGAWSTISYLPKPLLAAEHNDSDRGPSYQRMQT